jgi:FtsH-binding integral membrane protein
MNNDKPSLPRRLPPTSASPPSSVSVYGWMCAGLAVTALVAWYVASSPSLVLTLTRTPVPGARR